MLMSITTLQPAQAPAAPRRLAELALAHGFDVIVSEAHKKNVGKSWAVVGSKDERRFRAFWASTEAGGAKGVGQIADDGNGAKPVKARELTAWVAR